MNSKNIDKKLKGQISIFVILIFIILISSFFLTYNYFSKKEVDVNQKIILQNSLDLDLIFKNVEGCYLDLSKRALILSGLRGGFIYFDDFDKNIKDKNIKLLGTNIEGKYKEKIENMNFSSDEISNSTLFYYFSHYYIPDLENKLILKFENRDVTHFDKSIFDDIKRYIVENQNYCEFDRFFSNSVGINISNLEKKNITITNNRKNGILFDIDLDLKIDIDENIKFENEKLSYKVNIDYSKMLGNIRSFLNEKTLNKTYILKSDEKIEIFKQERVNEEDKKIIFYSFAFNENKINNVPFIINFGYYNSAPDLKNVNEPNFSINNNEITLKNESGKIDLKKHLEFFQLIDFYKSGISSVKIEQDGFILNITKNGKLIYDLSKYNKNTKTDGIRIKFWDDGEVEKTFFLKINLE